MPSYVKNKIWMTDKTIKHAKKSLFVSPNRGQTSLPIPIFYFIFRCPPTISTTYRKIKKILAFSKSLPNLLKPQVGKFLKKVFEMGQNSRFYPNS